jgi:hypothetical protein
MARIPPILSLLSLEWISSKIRRFTSLLNFVKSSPESSLDVALTLMIHTFQSTFLWNSQARQEPPSSRILSLHDHGVAAQPFPESLDFCKPSKWALASKNSTKHIAMTELPGLQVRQDLGHNVVHAEAGNRRNAERFDQTLGKARIRRLCDFNWLQSSAISKLFLISWIYRNRIRGISTWWAERSEGNKLAILKLIRNINHKCISLCQTKKFMPICPLSRGAFF